MSEAKLIYAKPTPKRRNSRRIWPWIGLVVCILAVLVIAMIWFGRVAIAERSARLSLERAGYDVDLSIETLTLRGLEARNVVVSKNGSDVLSAAKINVNYRITGLKSVEVGSVTLTEPEFTIRVDEDFRVVEPAIGSGDNGSSNAINFPPGGVKVQKGSAIISTPYGQSMVLFDGQAMGPEDIQGDLFIEPTRLARQDAVIAMSADVSIEHSASQTIVSGVTRLEEVSYAGVDLSGAEIRGEHQVKRQVDSLDITSTASSKIESISARSLSSRGVDISWDTAFKVPMGGLLPNRLDGDVKFDMNEVSVDDPELRRTLAARATLKQNLSALVSTAPFSKELSRTAEDLLARSSARGSASISIDPTQRVVRISSPVVLRNSKVALTFSEIEQGAAYDFDQNLKELTVHGDAKLEGKFGAKFENFIVKAASDNGLSLEGVRRFDADLKLTNTWVARTADGQVTRLRPTQVDLSYQSDGTQRDLALNGVINFDGDIPGGYVKGLRTRGHANISTHGSKLRTVYRPTAGSNLSIGFFANTTDWEGKDLSFALGSDPIIFERTTKGSTLSAILGEGEGNLDRIDSDMAFDFDFASAVVNTDISENGQEWTLAVSGGHMTSDVIPSPGTDMSADVLDMKISLRPDRPMEIDVSTPSASAVTQLLKTPSMPVRATGTPDRLNVSYGPGEVRFAAGNLPRLTLTGDVVFEDGVWAGDALTFVPLDKNAPVHVTYQFQDGVGSAKVRIDDLVFSPDGLQPQYLVSTLRGKIAEVRGRVSADIDLEFGAGSPVKSSGTAVLSDFDFGTLPGPVEGVNASLSFDSFFPLKTRGRQSLTVETFDPGFPLENGMVDFELIPDGVDIFSANWPVGDGFISLDPARWVYTAQTNNMTLRVNEVSVAEIAKDLGMNDLYATGIVSGALPVEISGVNVNVIDGELRVKDGGTIRFESAHTNAAGESNQYAEYAFEALKDFHYRELALKLNGPLDGEMEVYLVFDGRNPKLLGGAEFLFRVNVTGELLNIARSFNLGQQIGAKVINQIKVNKKSNIPLVKQIDLLELDAE